MAGRRRGAYGFRLTGVPGADPLLVDAPEHWPPLELVVRVSAEPAPPADRLDERTAVLALRSGGSVSIDRAAGRATFAMPSRPADGALVHPHLAGVAVVSAHWLGRESFHAGGFVADGGVWGLLGDKQAGKSTLLAKLALAGVDVFSDDVLVLDGFTALAGPRSLDLRGDAASQLGVGEPLGVIGGRERWRLALAPLSAELPLRGWVVLDWAEKSAVRALRGAARLQALLPHRGARLYPPDPHALVELSALPVYLLERPPSWSSADDVVQTLLDAVG